MEKKQIAAHLSSVVNSLFTNSCGIARVHTQALIWTKKTSDMAHTRAELDKDIQELFRLTRELGVEKTDAFFSATTNTFKINLLRFDHRSTSVYFFGFAVCRLFRKPTNKNI